MRLMSLLAQMDWLMNIVLDNATTCSAGLMLHSSARVLVVTEMNECVHAFCCMPYYCCLANWLAS